MGSRALMNRLYYFTIEDENMLAEAFAELTDDVFVIAYKVQGTDDVFVTTSETRGAMDGRDMTYALLAEEQSNRIALLHSPLSSEELSGYEDALKALALSYRAIAMACVGINGESNLGFDLSEGTEKYTYFTAPAGHTFIWRVFTDRQEAESFLAELTLGDQKSVEWAKAIPLASADELEGFH